MARGAANSCTRPTTSPRSPAASARPRARPPARSPSTQPPVTIKQIELPDRRAGLREGWIEPQPRRARRPASRWPSSARARPGWPPPSSSPAPGHDVVVFEKDDRLGGCCATASPTSSWRSTSSTAASSRWRPRAWSSRPASTSGEDVSAATCAAPSTPSSWPSARASRATCACPGASSTASTSPWTSSPQQNRRDRRRRASPPEAAITAAGQARGRHRRRRHGRDCVGTAIRQGAGRVTQIEILPKPPRERPAETPGPPGRRSCAPPPRTRKAAAPLERLDQGDPRRRDGRVRALRCVKVEWVRAGRRGAAPFKEIPGSAFELPADLVLLAMGFVHVEHGPLVTGAGRRAEPGGLPADGRRTDDQRPRRVRRRGHRPRGALVVTRSTTAVWPPRGRTAGCAGADPNQQKSLLTPRRERHEDPLHELPAPPRPSPPASSPCRRSPPTPPRRPPPPLLLPIAEGRALFEKKCVTCHTLERSLAKKADRKGWDVDGRVR